MNLNKNLYENIVQGVDVSSAGLSEEDALGWREGILDNLFGSSSSFQAVNHSYRIAFALIVGVSIFLLLLLRTFNLQVINGEKNLLLSEGNRIRVKRITPERGLIYDREGTVLAESAPGFLVGMELRGLEEGEIESSLRELSGYINLNYDSLSQKVKHGEQNGISQITLQTGLKRDTVLQIDTHLESMPGIYTEAAPVRDYDFGEEIAHVIGYTGEIDPEEFEEFSDLRYMPGDRVGKMGVERVYEEYLHGKVGRRLLEADASGDTLREVATEEPVSGAEVHLNIDYDLQKVAYNSLKEKMEETGATGGAVVALDPSTGEVLSLVSAPSFDPNVFTRNVSSQEFQSLISSTGQPFFNRAISAQYPPASTFKMVTATAALEEGVINPQTRIKEVQTINAGGQDFSNWTLLWGVAPHGLINVSEALAYSSDIFFYEVGGGYQSQEGVGIENLSYWAREFGFGSKTGIDLPGEESGLVPDKAYKRKVKGEEWFLGDTYISAIGQGDTLSTPLQVANMTAVVANGGKLMRPFVVSKVVANTGKALEVFDPLTLKEVGSAETISVVRQGMRGAVEYGTSQVLNSLSVPVAAKTGTAETGYSDKIHAWFTSFAPYDEPEIVVTVFLEEGGQGSEAALPVAREILEAYFSQ